MYKQIDLTCSGTDMLTSFEQGNPHCLAYLMSSLCGWPLVALCGARAGVSVGGVWAYS